MGKKLIIKGADFSENALPSVVLVLETKQGYLIAISGDTRGGISATNEPQYPNRIFGENTIPVNPGKTLTLRTDPSLFLASICMYSININFPNPASTTNTDYVPYCVGAEILSDPANNYQYVNNSDNAVYIALTFKKSDGAIIPSDYNIEYDVL